MYNDYERVKLLFEYTKFHIGVYITLASMLVGVAGLAHKFDFKIYSLALVASIVFIMVAGLAGGIIVSRLTQVESYGEFWGQKTGPIQSIWFKGEIWTYIEHVSFWVGLLLAVIAFLIPALTFSGTQLAGDAENVTIVKLGSGPDFKSLCGVSCVVVKVNPPYANHANCSENKSSWDFALDTSTESGKQAYSHLLASHMSDKIISIYGKGTCIGDSGYEAINFLITK